MDQVTTAILVNINVELDLLIAGSVIVADTQWVHVR